MGQKMYNVTIQGITKQYPEKIPYSEIVKEYEGSTDAPVMLVIVNGRLRELHKHLKADCEIEFVTSKDPIGHKTYCRSASLILLKAIYDVAGQENIDSVVIHYSVGSGYYFTMKGPMALDQEFIDKVKAQMHRIVDENLPIVKRSVSTSEAVTLFHKHHMYDKEKLFNYRRSSAVNLYSIGSFEDYFYGFMANHTGYIKTFDLFLYEGGFVLQLPTQNEPDRIPEFKPREKIFRVQKESQEWGDKLDIATVGDLNEKVTRGGAGLIRTVVENSTVPVIQTGTGNCHIFVDESADFHMALDIIFNAKTQRIGVCNACESLVVHRKIAADFLPLLRKKLEEKQVEIRADEAARAIEPSFKPAEPEDWGTEYLDYILSLKLVDSLDEAIRHINTYNTGHSEAIITSDYFNAQKFLDEVDAAAVYVNASTRFTDGEEFGFGAEIGISTQKLHARGPMGLKELTTTKYIIYGDGQIRS